MRHEYGMAWKKRVHSPCDLGGGFPGVPIMDDACFNILYRKDKRIEGKRSLVWAQNSERRVCEARAQGEMEANHCGKDRLEHREVSSGLEGNVPEDSYAISGRLTRVTLRPLGCAPAAWLCRALRLRFGSRLRGAGCVRKVRQCLR
jgi:hypothetical protein